jgi:SAM-dependent methyltransferase
MTQGITQDAQPGKRAKTLYTSGAYLEKNQGWHVEESPWKARQVLKMLAAHQLTPQTICEVGCGVGEVLKKLQDAMDPRCQFWGYDIAHEALERAQRRANAHLQFKQADITQEPEASESAFDLLLVLDVIEHLEDYFQFLVAIKPRSRWKIFHIPLDLSVQTLLRPRGLLHVRELFGHVHYFTRETALAAVQECGYTVLDAVYTRRALEIPSRQFKRNLLNVPRLLVEKVHQETAVRLFGGWSLLVLVE